MILFCGQYIRTVAMPELSANRPVRKKIVGFRTAGLVTLTRTCCVYTVYTQCTHGNNLTTSALVQAGTVRRYRLNARRMATPCIGSSSSSSEFSTWMFLPGQICPIFENLMTFLKVPGRFSTSWNSESLRKLQPYTIMGTLPSNRIPKPGTYCGLRLRRDD